MTLMTQDDSLVPATLAMLSIISFIGSLGNGLVIAVYNRKHDQLTATLFIIILAINDCFTCVTIIPITIYIESQNWSISNDVLCRLYYFLNNASIPFSAFLISLIAVDRYFCICHPFSRIMTLSRSKISIMSVLIVALLIGTASNFQVKMIIHKSEVQNSSDRDKIKHFESKECVDFSRIQNATISEKIFFNIVQKSQMISYTLSIVIVICLYIAIYCAVLRSRKRRKELKGYSTTKRQTYSWENHTAMVTAEQTALFPLSKLSSSSPQSKSNLMTSQDSTPCSKGFLSVPGIENRRVSLRSICETDVFQNFRTAAMLFVVAVSYIISFLPAFLMVNNWVKFNLPLFYLYYMNNAANPIIYCFMNSKFRQDIKLFIASMKN